MCHLFPGVWRTFFANSTMTPTSSTSVAVNTLVARDQPLVAVLWGRDAQTLTPLLGKTPTVVSPHPSEMSADRGFFGSAPFSRVNTLLIAQGAEPIDWTLP